MLEALKYKAYPVAIAIVSVAAVYGVLVHASPIRRDSGVFMYGGLIILDGGAPYIDTWDHKGPFLYILNALGIWLFDGSITGVILVEGLLLAAALSCCIRIWSKIASPESAFVIGIAYVLAYVSLFEGGNSTETWTTPFTLVAYSIFASWMSGNNDDPGVGRSHVIIRFMVVGFAIGVAAMVRPNNGCGLIFVAALMLIFDRSRLHTKFTCLAAGFLLVALPSTLFVVWRGGLNAMFDQYIIYNLRYASGIHPVDRYASAG